MPRKNYTIEQIISKLREAEVLLAQGQTAGEVCRSFNISEQTYYRRRKEYGGIIYSSQDCGGNHKMLKLTKFDTQRTL
jgi:DNA invertase Pin-like site-specific DNA recombinase